jgi:hypothetical protein
MSRRRRQGLSPTLFPFLAVLVCTLGTLILLLALVAENAAATAEQRARSEQQVASRRENADAKRPRITRVSAEAMLSDEEFRVRELVAVRDQQTADLETKRDELTHVDDHIERLRQQLRQLNQEVQLATGELDSQAITDAQLQAIRERIESERDVLEQLREASSDQTPRVVIVPHKGPNGTDRRPVYLECSQEGITIWPEGSKITMEQLVNASYSANPLDAALRTIRMHAMQNYGDSVPPYPLLVVRPDGIETYGAARRAMQDWDDQFGYELVPADVKLAFSKPDSNLKRRVEVAISTAVAEQRVRLAMAQRAHGSRGTLTARSVPDSEPPRTRLPTLSAAALDRAGRASGFGHLADDFRSYSPTSSSYARGPEIGSVTRNGYVGNLAGADEAVADARRMAEQMASAADELRSNHSSPEHSAPAGRSGSGTVASGSSSRFSSAAEKPLTNGPSQGEFAQQSRADSSQADSLAGRSQLAADGGPGEAEGFPSDASADGAPGDWIQTERGGRETNPINPPLNRRNYSLAAPSVPNESNSRASAGQMASGSSRSPASSSSPASASSSSAASSSPMQGSPVNRMDEELSADPRLAAQVPRSLQASLTPSSDLVRREGRDWALPESMSGIRGNAIIRTIRVQCYPDRFVLLPSKSEGSTEVFSFFNGDVARASLELATRLRDRIETWGPALPGGRWQPRLEVEIKPNSELRFHQLRTLMNGSGVELVGREVQ